MKLILCKNCKIKIEDTYEVCPVCNINQVTGEKEVDVIEENIIRLGWKKLVINIAFLMTLIPSTIALAINYLNEHAFTWSILVVIPIMAGWLYLLVILTLSKKPILLCSCIMIITILLLYAVNYLQQGKWFVSFGIPLSIGIPIISYISFYMMGKNRENPLRILGIFVFASLIICIFIDILYVYLVYQKLFPTWSLIVLGASLPLVIILFYLSAHKHVMERWIHF